MSSFLRQGKEPKIESFFALKWSCGGSQKSEMNFSLKTTIWKNENQIQIDENWQWKNALMATATIFKSICYYGKMMQNRISGHRDYNASLHVVWQDAKEPDPRSNKYTTPVIKLKLMKTDSVEMLWWRRRQYLNPSATMGRWCTIEFPGDNGALPWPQFYGPLASNMVWGPIFNEIFHVLMREPPLFIRISSYFPPPDCTGHHHSSAQSLRPIDAEKQQ